jgi:predicted ArsR family transcriptional regulator
MGTKRKRGPTEVRTRRTILGLLKQDGPHDALSLAARLGVSPMAVRQHLWEMQTEQLVTYDEVPRPLGRPAKEWRLTPAADKFFPDGHADLTVGLLGAMQEAFGRGGMKRLLEARTKQQVEAYRPHVPAGAPLAKKLESLAALRTQEGYMAQARAEGGGTYLLVENHCPICTAARGCPGLCASEQEVFEKVLGPAVSVERTEHIASGDRRCTYRITKRPGRRCSSPAPSGAGDTKGQIDFKNSARSFFCSAVSFSLRVVS